MEHIAQFLAEAVVAAAAEPASPEGGVWTESDHSRLIHFAVTGTEAGQYSRDGVLSFRWRDGAALRPVPGRKGAVPPGLEDAIRLFLRAPAGALAEAALRGRREGCLPATAPDTGAGWVERIRAHPEDGAACEWGKLGAEDWIRLLSSNPEWAWRPEWRRIVPEGEWKAFLRERRREESFRSAPRAPKRGRWLRPPAA